MSDDGEKIRAAKEAWASQEKAERESWGHWLLIITGLDALKQQVLRALAAERRSSVQVEPKGKKYSTLFSMRLIAHNLHGISKTTRKACLDCAPYLQEIAKFREQTAIEDPEKAKRLNHPQTVWAAYKASISDPPKSNSERAGKTVDKSILDLPPKEIAAQISERLGSKGCQEITERLLRQFDRVAVILPGESDEIATRLRDKLGLSDHTATALGIALIGRDYIAEYQTERQRADEAWDQLGIERQRASRQIELSPDDRTHPDPTDSAAQTAIQELHAQLERVRQDGLSAEQRLKERDQMILILRERNDALKVECEASTDRVHQLEAEREASEQAEAEAVDQTPVAKDERDSDPTPSDVEVPAAEEPIGVAATTKAETRPSAKRVRKPTGKRSSKGGFTGKWTLADFEWTDGDRTSREARWFELPLDQRNAMVKADLASLENGLPPELTSAGQKLLDSLLAEKRASTPAAERGI